MLYLLIAPESSLGVVQNHVTVLHDQDIPKEILKSLRESSQNIFSQGRWFKRVTVI